MNHFFFTGFFLIQISLFGCAAVNADDLDREQRVSESPQWERGKISEPGTGACYRMGEKSEGFLELFL